MSQRTGKVSIYIDGSYYESDGKATATGFTPKREPVIGDKVQGYKETPVPAECSCKLIHGGGLDATMLQAITSSSLTFLCDSGDIYVLPGCWVAESAGLNGGEGTVDVKFQSSQQWVKTN